MTQTRPSLRTLSHSDLRHLQANWSSDARSEIATRLGAEYRSGGLSDEQRLAAEEILRHLMRDAEDRVRAALAEQIKSTPELPRDVALALARDVETVALPILRFSDVLDDDDLVEILREGNAAKQVAIAQRPTVSARVAEELLDTGNDTAVATLVANRGAQLDDRLLDRAQREYAHSEAVSESLAQRPNLPPAVSEQLMNVVGQQLMSHLMKRRDLPVRTIKALLGQARDRATISLLRGSGQSDEELMQLVEQLDANGRLNSSIAFRALSRGDLPFFEVAMARLANLPLANARTLIHDQGELGLQAILQAALTATRHRQSATTR